MIRQFLAVACLVFAFTVPAGFAAAWEDNTDRPGSDYKNFDLQPGDGYFAGTPMRAHDCKTACDQDSKCMAWTYVRAGVQGSNPRCWLKTEVPKHRHSNCCVSGFKTKPGLILPRLPSR